MDLRDRALPETVADLADEATATVRRWLDAAAGISTPAREARLAELVADPDGASFAVRFVDGVLRPHDLRVAGRNLDRLSRALPNALHWYSELGAQLAGGFAPLLPAPIVPLARDAFLRSVGHLLLRLDGPELRKQLAELVAPGGIRPVLAPIAATASGQREASRQILDAGELLSQPDATGVSISLASVIGRPRLVDLDGVVHSALDLLSPLVESAMSPENGSIDFDVQRLDELTPTLRVLHELGKRYPALRLGIGLPACLPDSLAAVEALTTWARRRKETGHPPVTVRVTKGEQLGEGRVDALLSGLPAAPFGSRVETGGQFLRMLDHLLKPALAGAVQVVAATHDLFDTAWAWRLARRRRVEGMLEHEFMLGLATAQVAAAKRDLGGIRLYTPVVQPGQLSLATAYLIRRLRDLSGPDSFLSNAARIAKDEELLAGEEARFRASLAAMAGGTPSSHRRYDPLRATSGDFTLEATREWASGVLARTSDSAAGEALLARTRLDGSPALLAMIERTAAAGREWGERRGSTRATVLDSVAEVLAEWRGLLVEVAVSESGLTIVEADAEVTAAIGLAHRSARNARELDRITDAVYRPPTLAVIVPPRSGPIARPAGAVLATLAAGGAVILKTAPETRRSSAVLLETLIAGGVPEQLLGLVDDESDLARELICHPQVDRVLLDGSRHTAKLFHSWRAELPLRATIGGRTAIIVTPSADLEGAVADIVASAFDHAGQSATAASTVILVGSVGESGRFLGRLRDAVASLPTGRPGSVTPAVSALARPAVGRVLEALEVLGPGESWLVRPQKLDESGRLWSPGLRDGVQHGSGFQVRENRAPVLGIMRAATLAEAIELQNAPGFGLAAGIQSLDADELHEWFETAQAGMLFANRPVATARPGAGSVVLLPYVGWNRSNIGPGSAAAGPNELVALGEWSPVSAEPGSTVSLDGVDDRVARLIDAALPSMTFEEFDRVRVGALSDAAAWRERFSRPTELGGSDLVVGTSDAGFAVERDLLRYRPVPVTIRLAEGAATADLVRVLAAATMTRAAIAISSAVPLHANLIELFGARDSPVGVAQVLVESDARWRARVQAGEIATTRIRLIGGDRAEKDRLILARVLHGQPGIAVYADPVTASGRIELLPFLIEQTISSTTARFGQPDPTLASLPPA
jgi:RHH-type proline utilization regulon transcriptional repressor/proline dehydrogenase/delta 1-pyrroline-5-carboxylate dehydrogenase